MELWEDMSQEELDLFHHYRDGRLHYTDGRVLVNASCRKLGHIDKDNSSSSIR